MPSETPESTNITIDELLEKFSSSSERQKRRLTTELESRSEDLSSLGPSLLNGFDQESDDWTFGWIFQILNRHQKQFLSDLLKKEPLPWFVTPSSNGIDYEPLQQSLLEERFEDSDRITSQTLRKLAGDGAVDRGYVYFSEVDGMDAQDLNTLDRLWTAYSQGRFGFSAQARLLESLDDRYDKLWPRIGWKLEGVWTRYPNAFTWSLEAPEGHMPLVNQLRGVRLMDAYMKHPFLKARKQKA